MSAVFGLWNRDGRTVAPDSIARMGKALAHHGPIEHIAGCGSVALGRRQQSLATGDRARAPDGRVHAAFSGRLDDRDNLIGKLRDDHLSSESSDVEVVI